MRVIEYNKTEDSIKFTLERVTDDDAFVLRKLGGEPTADSGDREDGTEDWWFNQERG